MNDQVREVSNRSWAGRLVDAIKGVLTGFILLIASFPLLWWNEARAVQTARSLDEGQASVVSVKADTVDATKDGKLVHLTGQAATTETLQDNAFGVAVQALRLSRKAEMYQWVEDKKTEKRKKVGGGEESVTTYDYSKKWKDSLVRSSEFKQPAGHGNPSMMPYEGHDVLARNATIGAFHLPEEVIRRIDKLEPWAIDASAAEKLPPNLAGKAKVAAGMVFVGADPDNPQVGDVRVGYKIVAPQTLSVVARQTGNTFAPYKAQAGDEILLVDVGAKDAGQMFQTAQEANTTLTWILRLVGYLMMAIGIALILRPLVVVADFIPMIGNFAGFSATLFALVAAFPISVLVIAVAWVSVRPLVGIALLVAVAAGLAGLVAVALMAWKKRHRLRAAG